MKIPIPSETATFLHKHNISDFQLQLYFLWQTKLRERLNSSLKLVENPVEKYWEDSLGTPIYTQSTIPDHPDALVLAQHGNTVQSDLFKPLQDFLYSKKIGLIAVDNRGHGRSATNGGDLHHPAAIFPVYSRIILYYHKKYPKCPIYLMGESLGCTMMAEYYSSLLSQSSSNSELILNSLKGIILQVPPFQLRLPIPERVFRILYYPLKLVTFLLQIISLRIPFHHNVPVRQLSYLDEFWAVDQLDPIRAMKTSARHLHTALTLLHRFPRLAQNFHHPVLVLEGTADELLNPAGTQLHFEKMIHARRKMILYKGAHHSLFHDQNSLSVISDIYTWLKSQIE